jgi:hypothetical protein
MPSSFGMAIAWPSAGFENVDPLVNFVVRGVFIKPKRLFKLSLPSFSSSAKIDLD